MLINVIKIYVLRAGSEEQILNFAASVSGDQCIKFGIKSIKILDI